MRPWIAVLWCRWWYHSSPPVQFRNCPQYKEMEMELDDLRCCGNCKHRQHGKYGDTTMDRCGVKTRGTPGSWQWCQRWEWDEILHHHRVVPRKFGCRTFAYDAILCACASEEHSQCAFFDPIIEFPTECAHREWDADRNIAFCQSPEAVEDIAARRKAYE